jgi:hypothetical protein
VTKAKEREEDSTQPHRGKKTVNAKKWEKGKWRKRRCRNTTGETGTATVCARVPKNEM